MADDVTRFGRKAGGRPSGAIALPEEHEVVEGSRRVGPRSEDTGSEHRGMVEVHWNLRSQQRVEESARQVPSVVQGPEENPRELRARRSLPRASPSGEEESRGQATEARVESATIQQVAQRQGGPEIGGLRMVFYRDGIPRDLRFFPRRRSSA